MKSVRLSRRTLLRGAGGLALALPWLESMEAHAQTAAPKRFVGFFSGNGVVRDRWLPTGSETGFTLSPALAPLAPFRSKLLVLSGIDLVTARGRAVHEGNNHILTGIVPNDPGGAAGIGFSPGGISIDQRLANAVGGATRIRSLDLGMQTLVANGGEYGRNSPLALGAGLPLLPEVDPLAIYNRIVAAAAPAPADVAAARLRAQRKSVLDAVKPSFTDLQRKVSGEDRGRLDAHFTALRDIERGLDALPVAACTPPGAPASIDYAAQANFLQCGRLMSDLVAFAFSCDLTRVATLIWSNALSQIVHRWLTVNGQPITEGHHDLSHEADSNALAQQKLEAINTWYAQQFAYLLQKLDAVQEGGRTLLDNTVVWWSSEISIGNTHDVNDMPFVLAGSCGGYFRTGRFVSYPNDTPHNRLLVSICNAMGLPVSSFGDQRFTGPLPNLT